MSTETRPLSADLVAIVSDLPPGDRVHELLVLAAREARELPLLANLHNEEIDAVYQAIHSMAVAVDADGIARASAGLEAADDRLRRLAAAGPRDARSQESVIDLAGELWSAEVMSAYYLGLVMGARIATTIGLDTGGTGEEKTERGNR